MKQTNEASVPQVGIFWILPGGLLAFGVPYTAGEKYGDFINTPDGHYETWDKLRQVSEKTARGLYILSQRSDRLQD